jgi:hypothetical protein
MNAQGTDLWVKSAIALVAVTFVLSLPTWALGVVLAVALVAKLGIKHLHEQDTADDSPRASSPGRGDAR